MLLNEKIVSKNLQVHTTRFVTFTIQKPSVMMLAVRSHANAVLTLIQLSRCKLKVLGETFWYSSDRNLLSGVKNL